MVKSKDRRQSKMKIGNKINKWRIDKSKIKIGNKTNKWVIYNKKLKDNN